MASMIDHLYYCIPVYTQLPFMDEREHQHMHNNAPLPTTTPSPTTITTSPVQEKTDSTVVNGKCALPTKILVMPNQPAIRVHDIQNIAFNHSLRVRTFTLKLPTPRHSNKRTILTFIYMQPCPYNTMGVLGGGWDAIIGLCMSHNFYSFNLYNRTLSVRVERVNAN